MRKILLTTFLTIVAASAFLSLKQEETSGRRGPAAEKEFTYKYNYPGSSLPVSIKAPPLTLKVQASDYNEGLKIASKKCFDHYGKIIDLLDGENGLDVIDVCANPR